MFPRLITVSVLALASVLSGNGATSKHAKAGSGIQGTVVLTGNCPGPQRIGETCAPRPYQGKLAVRLASNQQVVTMTETDGKGDFKVAVAPGKYFITQGGEAKYPMIHSHQIVVVKNKFTTVQIQGDLGMR
jgi:hypothetical protein